MRPQGFADLHGCEHRILRDVVKQRRRACDSIRYGVKFEAVPLQRSGFDFGNATTPIKGHWPECLGNIFSYRINATFSLCRGIEYPQSDFFNVIRFS